MLARASVALAIVALLLLAATALPLPGRAGGEADVATGRALFAAKGCATCHFHPAIAGSGQHSGGPGGPPAFAAPYGGDPAFLRAWLRDPQAARPTATMPNLGLREAEIAALIAFLRADVPAKR